MGLEIVCGVSRRTRKPIFAREPGGPRDASTPSLPRTDGSRNLSQLHGEFRRTVPVLSERRGSVPEGACSLCGQLQLSTFSAWTFLRRLMRRLFALASLLILAA